MRGYTVTVLLFNVTDRGLSDACRHYRDELTNVPGVSFTEITNDFNPPVITRDAIVIDGLFGSGLKEPLKGGFKSLVDYINSSNATIVSIDMPSGMFGEWNEATLSRDVVHATLTLAIEFPVCLFLFRTMRSF